MSLEITGAPCPPAVPRLKSTPEVAPRSADLLDTARDCVGSMDDRQARGPGTPAATPKGTCASPIPHHTLWGSPERLRNAEADHSTRLRNRWKGTWTATIVSILTAAALLLAVTQAGNVVEEIQRDTNRNATAVLADAYPTSICVNATTKEVHGAKASMDYMCAISGQDFSGSYKFSNAGFEFDPDILILVSALHECNVTQSWYDKEDLVRFLRQSAAPPLGHMGQDERPKLTQVFDLRVRNNAMNSLDMQYFMPDYHKPNWGNNVLTPPEEVAIPAWSTELRRIGYKDINNSTSVRESDLMDWKVLDGTLRLAMYQALEEVRIVQAVWLNLHQDSSSAQCLGKTLHQMYSDTYKDVYNTTTWTASSCWKSGRPVYLVPVVFEAYRCVDQLDTESWGDFSNVQAAVRVGYRVRLWGTCRTFDEVYAIYTGALGALFGAIALALVSLVCAIIISVCRQFPESTMAHFISGVRQYAESSQHLTINKDMESAD